MYSVYFNKNKMMLGNKQFNINKDTYIIINKVCYTGISGLYMMIFKRISDDIIYTEDDM